MISAFAVTTHPRPINSYKPPLQSMCSHALFFSFTACLLSPSQVRGSWSVWPIAHAINFRLIPTSQRLLYINTIQIFYNCFLSIISQRE